VPVALWVAGGVLIGALALRTLPPETPTPAAA
jgi:hypothetical protein